MKFPLPSNVFPPVRLTRDQCAAFEQLVDTVVTDALDEYHAFHDVGDRKLSRRDWKQIKKRESLRVFCERRHRRHRPTNATAAATATNETNPIAATAKSGLPTDDSDAGANASASLFFRTSNATDENGPSRSTAASFALSELSDFESEDGDARDTTELSSPGSKHSSGSSLSGGGGRGVKTLSPSALGKRSKPLPKLLGVGRVPGKVEDMIYGLACPTPTHTMIKTAYVQDDIVDAAVLHEIVGATPDDPLRFLGLKWNVVKGHASVLGKAVRHRDFVFLESIGQRTRADGTRFWYYVMNSVDLPGCRELTDVGIVRGRLACVYLFRQDGATVDVFLKSSIEFNGSVSSKLALRTAAHTLASVALAEVSSHSRKMGWEVTKRLQSPRRDPPAPLSSSSSSSVTTSSPRCSNCNKRFHLFTTSLVCFFCTTRVCSKCCERRTLTIPNPAAKKSFRVTKLVTRTAVKACKGCYTTVFRSQAPGVAAREEIVAGEYGSLVPRAWPQPSEAKLPEVEEEEDADVLSERNISRLYGGETHHHLTRAVSMSSTSTMSVEDLTELVDQLARQSAMSSAEPPEPLEEEVEWEENGREWSDSTVIELNRDDGEWTQSAPTSPAYSAHGPQRTLTANADEDLYTRMSKLHQTAENLYQSVMSTPLSSSMVALRERK